MIIPNGYDADGCNLGPMDAAVFLIRNRVIGWFKNKAFPAL
jgi:hypothetical protein